MTSYIEKNDCCGCTACASACGQAAITMETDNEGFLYPSVDAVKCIHCGLCERVCPIVQYDQLVSKVAEPTVYAAYHVDERVRKASSSGGVFTALCDHIFKLGGCVYGAVYDEQWKVIHVKAETVEEAIRFRGSKYVQSDVRGIFPQIKEDLRSGRLVLFSGTPCQCQGLRGYLRKSYSNLYIIDIMCHGVPSPLIFAEYIKLIQKKAASSIRSINMKDKTLGWGRQSPRICFANGKEWFNTLETSLWNYIFFSHYTARPACYSCRFTNYKRPGDVTIGDYWGIEELYSDFYDKKGISFLFINSDRGKTLFDSIKWQLVYRSGNARQCGKNQHNLQAPITKPDKRDKFWHDYEHMGFLALCTKYFSYGVFNRMRRVASRLVHYIVKK